MSDDLTITLPVTFTITDDVSKVPLAFRINWCEGTHEDFEAEMDVGAGCGNTGILATGKLKGRRLYATGSVLPLANALFAELEHRMRDRGEVKAHEAQETDDSGGSRGRGPDRGHSGGSGDEPSRSEPPGSGS